MKILENYNDYILNRILESFKNDETVLVLSDRLKSYIEELKEHPIAKKLLYDSSNFYKNDIFKITLLDIVDKKDENGDDILDLISFTQSNKAIENVAKKLNITINKDEDINSYDNTRIISNIKSGFYDDLHTKNRTETKLGKIITKLYPDKYKPSGEPGNDIESFVNKYKALRNTDTSFELVNGDDIIYWYNEKRYGQPNQGPLHDSCMRYGRCSEYLDFYAKNEDNVSMLILKDPKDDTKIIGRALVWKISKINDNVLNEPRYFMDRIFYTNEYIIDVFKKYAKENGWLFKFRQNMDENERIIDSKTGENIKTVNVFNIIDTGDGHYPFLDTLKYFDYNGGILSNSEKGMSYFYKLTTITGDAESVEYFWSEYYGGNIDLRNEYYYCEWIDDYREEHECFWSVFYNVYIANDYAEENGIYCDYPILDDDDNGNNWRKDGDYVKLSNGKTATIEYAKNNLMI